MTTCRLTSDNERVVVHTGAQGADAEVYGRGVQAPLLGRRVERVAAVVPEPHIVKLHLLLFVVDN